MSFLICDTDQTFTESCFILDTQHFRSTTYCSVLFLFTWNQSCDGSFWLGDDTDDIPLRCRCFTLYCIVPRPFSLFYFWSAECITVGVHCIIEFVVIFVLLLLLLLSLLIFLFMLCNIFLFGGGIDSFCYW